MTYQYISNVYFTYICICVLNINIKFWGKKHLAIQSITKLVKSDICFFVGYLLVSQDEIVKFIRDWEAEGAGGVLEPLWGHDSELRVFFTSNIKKELNHNLTYLYDAKRHQEMQPLMMSLFRSLCLGEQ